MKIGLDSNNREFAKSIVKKIREENFFLIDMSIDKHKNEGYEIYKKTMLANATRLDLFIGIYFKSNTEKKEELSIFYDDTFLGEYFSNYIYDNLGLEYGKEILRLKKGESFYLLKNIKTPSLIIKGNLIDKVRFQESLKRVIKNIFEMENWN